MEKRSKTNDAELLELFDQAIESRLVMLRFSPDWQDVLYDDYLLFYWEKGRPKEVCEQLAQATNQPWLIIEGRNKKVFKTDGFYIVCLDPVTAKSGAGHRYWTTIQIQGAAWSRGIDLQTALSEIEPVIFGQEIPGRRILGRVDIAFDIWIKDGRPPALDIARGLHRWGQAGMALDRDWKTHLRKPAIDCKIIGREFVETFYLGSRSVAMVRIYRKDLEYDGNTAIYLRPQWELSGWNDTGVVLRVEFEIKREYIRTHATDDGRPLSSLKYCDWYQAYNAIATQFVNTVVHSPCYDKKHPERSAPSILWKLLIDTAARYMPGPTLNRFYAEPNIERARMDAERAVWRIQELLGTTEAARVLENAFQPTRPDVLFRRGHWQAGYLWTGHQERLKYEREEERERRRIEQPRWEQLRLGIGRTIPGGREEGGKKETSRGEETEKNQ